MALLQYKDRKGTNCAKWDILASKFGKADLLSMWVADMDFKEPPCVTAALRRYIDEVPFGYFVPPPPISRLLSIGNRPITIIRSTQNGFALRQGWCRPSTGSSSLPPSPRMQ